jgi:hypothetical protein
MKKSRETLFCLYIKEKNNMNYNIIVHLNNMRIAEIILPVTYEKEYELRRDVTSIGINGVWQKLEDKYLYFPSHQIERIEVVEAKS